MKDKQYWKSIEEKNPESTSDAVKKDDEFGEQLPNLSYVTDAITTKPTGRRDFLKMLGFSLTAATVAAGCEMPVRKSIPYVFKPEDITPGIPNYYASTYSEHGDYCSVLVKTREGRPIKIEGNNMSTVSHGGTSAKAQASVLSLYDENRIPGPMKAGEQITWEQVDQEIISKLNQIKDSGGKIRILSSSMTGPSSRSVVNDFAASYGDVKHISYDAISYDGILEANLETFGQRSIPDYAFDEAELIVSIGADFLGTWVSPIENSARYAKNRKVSREQWQMSRHIQIESTPSLTGNNADLRIPVRPTEEELSVIKLYNIIAAQMNRPTIPDDKGYNNEKLTKVATELRKARGKSIVVSGSNRKEIQIVCNAINDLLENYGNTIRFERANLTRQGSESDVSELIAEMSTGNVDALIIWGCNPVYSMSDPEAFKNALEKVDLKIALASSMNETASSLEYICPDHHYLESWDDSEPKSGSFSTTQPTIEPLHKTRQAQESLLTWSGNSSTYYEYMKQVWSEQMMSKQGRYSSNDMLWDSIIHDGVMEFPVEAIELTANFDNLSSVASSALSALQKRGSMELKLYEKVAMGDGQFADNPWAQETPDPISKITWDNYVLASPKWVEENSLTPDLNDKTFQNVKVSNGNYSIELPVVPQPGQPYGTFGIALGYGRTIAGKAGVGVGENAYPFIKDGSTIIGDISVEKGNGGRQMAATQTHFTIKHKGLGGEKVRNIVKETSLSEYKNYEGEFSPGNKDREFILNHLETIYPERERVGHNWAMGVDLNSCTGCSACVVACTAENNVPVVGQKEVRRAHEMHWLRIDRYYTGDIENPDVVFQPMMCQHCDNAPCENVCPVSATNHSSEGLNQMAYNRCFGTRYCANNCPYKVRRFNWFDYQGSDSFYENTPMDNYNKTALGGLDYAEPLSRMVLNPDVTVRSRGVMEKCSFCVQRIQYGKLEAKKDNRPLKESDIVTACQQACPTNAITFGDINNDDTEVSKWANDGRAFRVVEEIHTLPSVYYLTKVRNTGEDLA